MSTAGEQLPDGASGRRVAIVTGAARGLGLAIATRLAEEGWTVVAVDRAEGVLAAAGALRDRGLHAEAEQIDLAAPAAASALVERVGRRHGRIVSIGSVVGSSGNPGQVNYVAAKAGLVGLTKALAAEVAGALLIEAAREAAHRLMALRKSGQL